VRWGVVNDFDRHYAWIERSHAQAVGLAIALEAVLLESAPAMVARARERAQALGEALEMVR